MQNNFDWSKYQTLQAPQAPQADSSPTDAVSGGGDFDWSKYRTINGSPSMGGSGSAPSMSQRALSYPVAGLTGIAEGTRDIGNLLGKGINFLSSSLFDKDIIPKLPKVDFNQLFGLPEHHIISGLTSIIPAMAAGEAAVPAELGSIGGSGLASISRNVASQGAGSGILGASEAASQDKSGKDIAESGALSALTGGALGKGAELLGVAAKPAARSLVQHLVDPLVEKAAKTFPDRAIATPGHEALSKALNATRERAKEWEGKLVPHAKQLDSSIPFDNMDYLQKIYDAWDEIADKAKKEDPDFYNPIKNSLRDRFAHAPTSFESAIEQNAAINRMPSTWEMTNKPVAKMLRHYSGVLGNALQSQVEKNTKMTGAGNEFLNQWNELKSTYKKLKSFEKTPMAEKGEGFSLKYSKPQAGAITSGDIPAEDSLKYFLPTGSEKNTLKMQHFGNLIGNEPLGKQLLKNEYLAPAFDGDEFNPKKAMSLYGKLSPSQRTYLFSKREKELMDNARKAKSLGEKNKAWRQIARFTALPTTGAIFGGIYGHEHGHALESAGMGAALSALLPQLSPVLARGLSGEKGSRFLLNLAKKGAPSLKNISYPAIAGLIGGNDQ